jgi:ABC-type multidrug transport system ATPase subunit
VGAVLEARALRVARGRLVLLDDFSLTVEAGEILRVAGANGSGKSSLLRVLAGVAAPRRGRVMRTGPCAYVPERIVLPAAMGARRWVRAMARVRGGVAPELEPALDQRCGVLSKGQAQRVALADALGADASVLVLDEPWTGLDRAAAERLTDRLRSLADGGAAVLFTDHAATAALTPTRTLFVGPAPPAPSVRVVLAAPDGRREELVVPRAERDALLAERLAAGWGVEVVLPE